MIAELYTVYRTELLKYCCMICGNVSDAEDLLQETFMNSNLKSHPGQRPNRWRSVLHRRNSGNMQELALFEGYLPLGLPDDSRFKGLKMKADYVADQFVRRQTIVSQAEVDQIIKSYSKYKGLVSGKTQNSIIGVSAAAIIAIASGGAAFMFAPGIAAAIAGEAVVGLHGAALTSASLAFVGGGSLAAGGLGVAGGTAIITGGGALLGLVSSGGASATAILLQTSNDYWVRQSAKLLTYSKCVLDNFLNDEETVNYISDNTEKAVKTVELAYQKLREEDNDLDKTLIKRTSDYLKYLKKCNAELKKIAKK